MNLRLRLLVALWMLALNLANTWMLILLWPGSGAHWLGMTLEARFIWITAAAGALGSCIHLATSFVSHAGGAKLGADWVWWYALRPGIGAALAVVVYFVFRAGLISGSGDAATASMNPYGIAAVASLSGMFSRQATEKLKDIFEQVLSTQKDEAGDKT